MPTDVLNPHPHQRDPRPESLGPAMLACAPGQRRFVMALVALGGSSQKLNEAALHAGYSARNPSSLSVMASRLAQHPKVVAAIQEETGKLIKSSVISAAQTVRSISENITHKDQLKAAAMILDRGGLHAVTEHKVTVTPPTQEQLIQKIIDLAPKAGVDAKELLAQHGFDYDLIRAEAITLEASDGDEEEELEEPLDPEHDPNDLSDIL